ncbi:MAG: hypothetical protein OIF58_06585 [Cohaesibacter sp.]|nr:hypothetical protein [Cohaesibacter sp.]
MKSPAPYRPLSRLAKMMIRDRFQALCAPISRVLILCLMVNAMVLGFLSSSHGAAHLSGMALICGSDGIVSIPLADQKPDDITLIDHQECLTACLGAMQGSVGLMVAPVSFFLPMHQIEPLALSALSARLSPSLLSLRARGPPA